MQKNLNIFSNILIISKSVKKVLKVLKVGVNSVNGGHQEYREYQGHARLVQQDQDGQKLFINKYIILKYLSNPNFKPNLNTFFDVIISICSNCDLSYQDGQKIINLSKGS